MDVIDHYLQRFAMLDEADHLLNQVQIYRSYRPEAIAHQRAILREARWRLDSARSMAHHRR